MIQKFVEIGSFEVKHGRGKKSIASTSVVVEDVATALEDGMSSGVQTYSYHHTWYCPIFRHACEYGAQNNPQGVMHCYPMKITQV